MTFISIQNDFTHGEISPLAIDRFDIELYKKSVKKAKNVLAQPLGGLSRRFGLKYVDTITATSGQYSLIQFDFSDTIKYLFVFTNNNIAVYRDDVKVDDITTTYTGAQVTSLDFSQSFNLLIITHPDHAPAQIVNGGGDTSWTLSDIAFKNVPGYDYKRNYDTYTFTMSAVAVGKTVTLTSSTAVFTNDYIGGYFIATGPDDYDTQLGVGKITAVGSSTPVTTCTIDITSAFNSVFTSGGLTGKDCLLTEKAWSDDRGYPVSCTFFEGRLWFGGSKSLPETLFGSVSNAYDNFDIGTTDANDSIQVDIRTEGRTNIKYLVSDKVLEVFTASAEFVSPQLAAAPLSPDNMTIRRQSTEGVSDVKPSLLDNSTIYVAQGGYEVNAFGYEYNNESYNSNPISLISSHLIKNPVNADTSRGTLRSPVRYYFVVNGEDGSLAALQTLSSQNILAWTECTTLGEFKRVAHVGNETYFLIEREIDGNTVTYLEKADFDLYTDSSKTQDFGSPTTTVTGLSHLIGETVNVIADGFVLNDKVVSASGTIEIERSSSIVTVGIPFYIPEYPGKHTYIESLPFNISTQQGEIAFTPKRITRIFLDYYESLGILVNNFLIPSLEFGAMVLDQVDTPKSALHEDAYMTDWDPRGTINISQEKPLPMTILSFGVDLSG
jgi:hypothetical protein